MNLKLENSIALLPLRFEIRKMMTKNVNIVSYEKVQKANKYRDITLKHSEVKSDFKNPEYWIRWYPDEIHLQNPVGKITEREKSIWNEFINRYKEIKNQQKDDIVLNADDFNVKETKNLWIDFCSKIGNPVRACYIYRYYKVLKENNSWNFDNGITEFLFDIDYNLEYELSNKKLSNQLIEIFKQNNIILYSDNITLSVSQISSGSKIEIFNKSDNNVFIIYKKNNTDQRFSVYIDITEPIDIIRRGIIPDALPDKISIYTIKGAIATVLIPEITIKKDELLISPIDIEGSNWITNFSEAIEKGMGIRIIESNKIVQIDNADWLIAFGVNEAANSNDILADIFRRNNVNGELAIIRQDAPTNNTDESRTPYKNVVDDSIEYAKKTLFKKETDIGSGSDSDILAKIFHVEKNIFEGIQESGIIENNKTNDMAFFIWEGCTDVFHKYWTEKGFIDNGKNDWNNVRDYFVKYVKGRGLVPIIRIGKNPYGIYPVLSSRNTVFSGKGQTNTFNEKLYKFLLQVKSSFWDMCDEIKTLKPDEDNYDKLISILNSERISKEINVRKMENSPLNISADPEGLDCPLVREKTISSSLTKDETDYLFELSTFFDTMLSELNKLKKSNTTDINDKKINETFDKLYNKYISPKAEGTSQKSSSIQTTGATLANPPLLKILSIILLNKIKNEISELTVKQKDFKEIDKVYSKISVLKKSVDNLKGNTSNELEKLFLETLDVLSYRLDAWFSGIAGINLFGDDNGDENPPIIAGNKIENKKRIDDIKTYIGAYGWLEKPGDCTKNDSGKSSDGYIQAPSESQAVTAGILRNAILGRNNGDLKLDLNLSSAQIRKGLLYLDGVRNGYLPGEILGYELEKLIKENNEKSNVYPIKENDIYLLRDIFSIIKQDDESTGNTDFNYTPTVIDGLRFLNELTDKMKEFESKDEKFKKELNILYKEIDKIRDAASDLAVAEAAHQYINGNLEASAGWMDFLDGECPPPQCQFVKTPRLGERRTTKVFQLLAAKSENAKSYDNILKILDPVFDSYCNKMFPGFTNIKVTVESTYRNEKNVIQRKNISISFSEDLKLTPIDFVIRGEEEFLLSIKYFLLNELIITKEIQPISITNYEELLNGIKLSIPNIDLNKTYFGCLKRSGYIKKLIENNRTVDRGFCLKEDNLSLFNNDILKNIDIKQTYTDLSERIRSVLNDVLVKCEKEIDKIVNKITESGNDYSRNTENVIELKKIFEKLNRNFRDFSRPLIIWNEINPQSLAEEVKTSKTILEKFLSELKNKIKKINENILQELYSSTDMGKSQSNNAPEEDIDHNKMKDIVKELCALLKIDNLPVSYKYYLKDGENSIDWNINLNNPNSENAKTLEKFKDVRANIGNIYKLSENVVPVNIFYYDNSASGSSNTNFYISNDVINKMKYFSYYFIDSWSEFFPEKNSQNEAIQNTAVSFHYESPKNEAPNMIILAQRPFNFNAGVSANTNNKNVWTPDIIANTILETIEMMKIRMVTSSDLLKHPVLGKIFPMLIFGDTNRFPVKPKLFSNFDNVAEFHTVSITKEIKR